MEINDAIVTGDLQEKLKHITANILLVHFLGGYRFPYLGLVRPLMRRLDISLN